MSELKYYKLIGRTFALTSPEFTSSCEFGHSEEVYLKSEADKVIADLEESHKKKVEQLLMEIAELKEQTRWHTCSEELPPNADDSYMCAYKNKNKEDGIWLVDEAVWDGEKWSCKFDFWEDVVYWQFKPKAPDNKLKKIEGK